MDSESLKAHIAHLHQQALITGNRPVGAHYSGLAHIPRSQGGYAEDEVTLSHEPVAVEVAEQEDGSTLVTFDNGEVWRKTYDGLNRATERRDAERWELVGRWDSEPEDGES